MLEYDKNLGYSDKNLKYEDSVAEIKFTKCSDCTDDIICESCCQYDSNINSRFIYDYKESFESYQQSLYKKSIITGSS